MPDVVITDMLMPKMDGLQLVVELRAAFPELPVILVTALGSEDLAVQALERGAASYVPKKDLSTKIVDTVMQVIEVAHADRGHQELTERFLSSRLTLQLGNDPALILPLVNRLQQMLGDMGICDAHERTHVGIALEEALLNALFHGSLEIPGHAMRQVLSEHSQCKRSAYVDDRRAEPSYRDRRIYVEADVQPGSGPFCHPRRGPRVFTAEAPSAASAGLSGKREGAWNCAD